MQDLLEPSSQKQDDHPVPAVESLTQLDLEETSARISKVLSLRGLDLSLSLALWMRPFFLEDFEDFVDSVCLFGSDELAVPVAQRSTKAESISLGSPRLQLQRPVTRIVYTSNTSI